MVEIASLGGGVSSLPAVFFDGEREIELGNISVYSGLDFKTLQTLLSQRIGLSPHQFSVHLSSPDSSQKIPLTGKSRFDAIARHKDWLLVVVLKRSRAHNRRRKSDALSDASPAKNPPENVMLLRRNGGDRGEISEPWIHSFLMKLAYADESGAGMDSGRVGLGPILVKKEVDCEDCLRAKESGRVAEFHCCVNDDVVFGFRTRAGPIAHYMIY